MKRWIIVGFLAGWITAALSLGVLSAQPQNIVTLFGCRTATSSTCTTLQPVQVNSSGVVSVAAQ